MLRWRHLHDNAGPIAHLDGNRLEVRYRPGPGVADELTALARAEAECCAFVTWNVTSIAGDPVLHVTAPAEDPDAIKPIAALFGVDDLAQSPQSTREGS